MKEGEWSLQDAKNQLSQVVNRALAGTPQHVKRRGLPAVVVVAEAHYDELCRRTASLSHGLVDHLLAVPKATSRRDEFPRLRGRLRGLSP